MFLLYVLEPIVGVNSNSSAGAFKPLRPHTAHTHLALAVRATDQVYSAAPLPDKLSATWQQWAGAIWEMVTGGNGRNQAQDDLESFEGSVESSHFQT